MHDHLEAAQRLVYRIATSDPLEMDQQGQGFYGANCKFCGAIEYNGLTHKPDCFWLQATEIIS